MAFNDSPMSVYVDGKTLKSVKYWTKMVKLLRIPMQPKPPMVNTAVNVDKTTGNTSVIKDADGKMLSLH